jgi:hypothetical protein
MSQENMHCFLKIYIIIKFNPIATLWTAFIEVFRFRLVFGIVSGFLTYVTDPRI